MVRICPNPKPWNDVYDRLTTYAQTHDCMPPSPPVPMSLTGWVYSNDTEKMRRWEQTVEWATRNGCPELVEVTIEDFYSVDVPTSDAVGPGGDPRFRLWNYTEKTRPSTDQLAHYLEDLKSRWEDIVGPELSRITRPLAFKGAKARRLLVLADDTVSPPWGGWTHLSTVDSERRTFTRFREAINKAIAPHEVDHIDFITTENAD